MAISLPTFSFVSPHFFREPSSMLSSLSSLRLESLFRRFGSRHQRVKSPSSPHLAPLTSCFPPCWCGPCQLMVPILNEVSETLKDNIAVVKIDAEKYPNFANKYQIEVLPTFMLLKDGKLWDRFECALPANQPVQRIEISLQAKRQIGKTKKDIAI